MGPSRVSTHAQQTDCEGTSFEVKRTPCRLKLFSAVADDCPAFDTAVAGLARAIPLATLISTKRFQFHLRYARRRLVSAIIRRHPRAGMRIGEIDDHYGIGFAPSGSPKQVRTGETSPRAESENERKLGLSFIAQNDNPVRSRLGFADIHASEHVSYR